MPGGSVTEDVAGGSPGGPGGSSGGDGPPGQGPGAAAEWRWKKALQARRLAEEQGASGGVDDAAAPGSAGGARGGSSGGDGGMAP